MKRNKTKTPHHSKTEPKGKSKYALKGTEFRNKKSITIKATGHDIKVDKGYVE